MPWIETRTYNHMEYFKYELKQFIFQMLIIFAIRSHWVRYWLIYTVQSRCLSSLVDIHICLFSRKWLATPGLYSLVYTVYKIYTLTCQATSNGMQLSKYTRHTCIFLWKSVTNNFWDGQIVSQIVQSISQSS